MSRIGRRQLFIPVRAKQDVGIVFVWLFRLLRGALIEVSARSNIA